MKESVSHIRNLIIHKHKIPLIAIFWFVLNSQQFHHCQLSLLIAAVEQRDVSKNAWHSYYSLIKSDFKA